MKYMFFMTSVQCAKMCPLYVRLFFSWPFLTLAQESSMVVEDMRIKAPFFKNIWKPPWVKACWQSLECCHFIQVRTFKYHYAQNTLTCYNVLNSMVVNMNQSSIWKRKEPILSNVSITLQLVNFLQNVPMLKNIVFPWVIVPLPMIEGKMYQV